MNEPEKKRLIAILDEWRAENPTQIRVEGVRSFLVRLQARLASREIVADATVLLRADR
jgi:hypothetical protein